MVAVTSWMRTTLVSWLLVWMAQPMIGSSFYVEATLVLPFLSNLFSDILNPFVDVLARSTCQYLQSTAINRDEALIDYINCDCSASFTRTNGMVVNAFCALNEAICLDPTERIFCGTTNIEADFQRKTNKLKTTACLETDTGLSIEIDGQSPQIPEICLSAQSTVLAQRSVFRIDTCTIRIASRKCQSCTICDSGKDLKFDCSNIQLDTLIGNTAIPGPVLNTCVGIGFIFSNPLFNRFNAQSTVYTYTGNTTTAVP